MYVRPVEGPRELPTFSRAQVLIAGLLVIGVLLAGVLVARSHGGAAEAPPSAAVRPGSPNIILILTDDQRWDSMWAMPKTRHLLADHGVQFTNSFVVNSLCCPSRASILTGQYSHGTGVYTNFPPLGGYHAFDPTTTIATVLQARGYQTALMGKYLNGYTATRCPRVGHLGRVQRRQGRGLVLQLPDDPERARGAVRLRPRGLLHRRAGGPRDEVHHRHHLAVLPLLRAQRSAHAGHHGAARRPRLPEPQAVPAPAFNEKDTSDKPPWLQTIPLFDAARIAKEDDIYGVQTRSLPPVDDAVQRIVDTLKATGKLHNTLILFMSDNGYMHGEHRLGGKQSAYEESIRVPMILRYDLPPSRAGRRTPAHGPEHRPGLHVRRRGRHHDAQRGLEAASLT